jgi:hypothetical protein
MAVTFRYARIDEYPQIASFLNEHWANNHVYVRDKPLFDWTFHSPELWPESGYCFAMAEDNRELIGILGGIPFVFNTFGKSDPGVWIANYVIRPDHRKGTFALQLLSQFRKPSLHAVIASGINPATITIYKVLRGEVLPYMPRRVAVFPGATDRMAKLLSIAYPDWPTDQAQSLAGALSFKSSNDAKLAYGTALPEKWDTNDWPEIAEATIGVARDARFMNWRYVQHPRFQYRFVTIPEGLRTGLLVWRLETIRRTTKNGLEDVDKIGRIVELLPSSPDNAQCLLRAATQTMREEGAFAADYYGFHAATNRYFDEAGFVDTRSATDGDKVPSRFQPLDGKGGGILSAMFLTGGGPSFEDSTCPWYWTKADSDQDRPN